VEASQVQSDYYFLDEFEVAYNNYSVAEMGSLSD